MHSRLLPALILMAVSLLGTGCRGGDTAEISEEHRQYAEAFCNVKSRQIEPGGAVEEAMQALENAGRLDIRVLLATRILTAGLESSQRFSRDLAALTPPTEDEAFETTQLKWEGSQQEQLQLAIHGLESVDTVDDLGDVLLVYATWARDHPTVEREALHDASEELRQAVVNSPSCESRFFGLREF